MTKEDLMDLFNENVDRKELAEAMAREVNLLRPRTGWDHWWRMGQIKAFFQWLWYAPKRIWMRCKYGWCGYDLWDLDSYFLWVLTTALRYFAANTIGYPAKYEDEYGDAEGEDGAYDRWVADIRAEADLLEDILFDRDRFRINEEEHGQKAQKALDWLKENWSDLWW